MRVCSHKGGFFLKQLTTFSISGKMTTALVVYSAVFMRYSFVPLPATSPGLKFTDMSIL